ncbi:MAG: tRNA dihydrouridine synthase DusB [Acuticoccus sp.]
MTNLRIDTISLSGCAVLAPMSGISDWPFRLLAARYGAPLVVSEMVASDRLIAREEETRLKTEGAGLDVHAVQLAGCRADDLAEAARIAEGAGAHLIDINMGCPAKRVVGGWAGSALMRDIDHASSLIRATVAAVKIPVTVKMRLGFDRTMLNAPELARRAQDEGAALVTVHGRTRCQRYKGRADWGAIAAVKAAVTIPVIANGDCGGTADARTALARSGADGVMIGRAAVGAPWLPGVVSAALDNRAAPRVPRTPSEYAALALEHLETLCECAGVALGVRLARKHLSAYFDAHSVPASLRTAALTADTLPAASAAVAACFDAAEPRKMLAA